jgi:putative inorganic carbon (hco3(-)) transporter
MATIEQLPNNHAGNVTTITTIKSVRSQQSIMRSSGLVGAYVTVLAFMLIYFSRPEDWIPGLSNVPLEKFTGILALLALVFSLRHIRLRLPREVIVLFFLLVQLFLASAMSPVWRGGAFQTTLNFAKVLIVVISTIVAVNTAKRLRQLIFIQAASVAVIAAVAIWKGNLLAGRLEGILGGSYQDPNDLALVIIISLPLCLALLILNRNRLCKTVWALAILVMIYAAFLTGSRGGFLSLIAVTGVCLWVFAIRGRRRYLLVLAVLGAAFLWQFSDGTVFARLKGTLDVKEGVALADSSSQQREQLLLRSIEVTEEHPLFGVGPGNFYTISGNWETTHNSFTLMSSEGGIPALILYILILWFGFKNLGAIRQLAQGQAESKLLAHALHASLAGYVVGSFFLSVSYQFFPYILVAYTTALFSIAKKSAPRLKACEAVPKR